MANKMAAGHTGEVRIETGSIAPDPAFISKQNNMRQTTGNNLRHLLKNNFMFSLHRQKTGDINPIVKTSASGPDLRHCSTTFYH
ncbi:hypothetical protein [Desulfobacula sp.]|uniref:hypothetical protein n=1 Tax=Desulfobacula sp. TaxID=2593537 RepID=UPI002634CA4C|nr:hypothetical protein [Desulfobacula sp.]